MTLQSDLELIEHSVSIEPNPRTENSPSPPMTPKSSQAVIANGLAELRFSLSLNHFLTQSCHLYPPTVRSGPGLYLLAWSKTTTPPPSQFCFSATLSACDTHPQSLKLTIISNLLSLIITMYLLHCFGWSWYRHQYNMEAKMGKTQLNHLQ